MIKKNKSRILNYGVSINLKIPKKSKLNKFTGNGKNDHV